MADTPALWSLLSEAAEPNAAAALQTHVQSGKDIDLNRINAIAFAGARGLNEDATIGAFVRASQLGLFDMTWSALCPGCGGSLETVAALRTLDRRHYFCELCDVDREPELDANVEVTFTVNPRVRRIAAHDPDQLSFVDYTEQIFWGSLIDLPPDYAELLERNTLDSTELDAGERASMSLVLPPGSAFVFEPVTHQTLFLNVEGEETRERRNLSLVFDDGHATSETISLAPGPVRIAFDNRGKRRTLPAVWLLSTEVHGLMGRRRPFLTATRVFSNQTFRELYRNGTLESDQRFTITSLTILFTDLRGSTALYDKVGDLAAFDLVRSHFGALIDAVAKEGGAVVKTIGDAVMATFASPERAVRAALRMRAAMNEINQGRGAEDLALNIGLHEGPCLAVVLDERQDYFGQSVNIAARVQGLADPSAILATRRVVESPEVTRLLTERGCQTRSRESELRGVSEALTIYEIHDAPMAA